MRQVFESMGTTISVAIADPVSTEAVEEIFDDYDRRFSLYRADSELSRIARSELRLSDASASMLTTYAESLVWREHTGGLFTPHRPDGVIDLSGLVKAAAMRDASLMLSTTAVRWSLNVGGDVCVGDDSSERGWIVGIVDPRDRTRFVASVDLRSPRTAVATSGSAERGDHIWRGGSVAAPDFIQATVIADDIVTADVLATAIIAGGRAALDDITDRWSVDVLAIGGTGALVATPGFRAALACSPDGPSVIS